MNILIIGNSAASTAAIESIRKHDRQSSIIQLSDEAQPLYSRCLLTYYLSDSIDREKLWYREEGFHKKMAVDLHTGPGFRVIALNTDRQQVTCENGRTFNYDRLLLAVGSSAKLPADIPRDKGIFVLRNLADVEAIKQYIRDAKIKRAVISGGGLIGVKTAVALRECGLDTTIVVSSQQVLSQALDYHAAQVINKKLRENNIEILMPVNITEIISQDSRLRGVKINQGQVLDCDLLVVAKGVKPNIELAQAAGISVRRGIITNSFMQTNYENIFAAGDVAEAYDIAIEDHTINALWTSAFQQGRIAGLNMAGQKTGYNDAVGLNSFNVCDISIISIGLTSPKDESGYTILTLNQLERNVYKKIVIDKNNHIKGIILLGKIANAGVLLSLIQRKVDVFEFKDELLSDEFNYGTLLKYGIEKK
ncbi:MAG TPA: FAD-dependent oxidoreductase [Candidatus Deferrimicrobium sp.]|nr:FAD-dependent oxidoreductase [Candidatus Deferrimicrobium sp.]